MKIAALTMVYNEALILPYFLRHYEYLDEIHVLFETDSTDETLKILNKTPNVVVKNSHIECGLDDIDKVNLVNNALEDIKADWVYVLDSDEFIFPPNESPLDFLSRQNYDVVRAAMFQVYRHRMDNDLDPSLPPITQRIHGDPDVFSTVEKPNRACNGLYLKPIVVRPSSGVHFLPGNHAVEGTVKISPEFYMGAHWQMADPLIALDRRIKNRMRMSERNKALGMTWQHWNVTEEWIKAECDYHLDDPIIEPLCPVNDKSPAEIAALSSKSFIQEAVIVELRNQFKDRENQIVELRNQLTNGLSNSLQAKNAHISNLQIQLYQVQRGILMQLRNKYQRIIEKFLRQGSRRHRLYQISLTGIRVILNEGWRSFFRKAKDKATLHHRHVSSV